MDDRYSIITSDDGSHSVQISGTDTTFHSRRGAIQESLHVFINAGLVYFHSINPLTKTIKIFETGFGTGLNALLTAIQAPKCIVNIEYHSIDKYSLPEGIFFKLNYAGLLDESELYKAITQTPWNQLVFVTPFFKLKKIQSDLATYSFTEKFDIIFFDAFAPNDQPELWTKEVFERMSGALKDNGILVTYCSKSIVRKALQAAGFIVEKLPGPPGKREILRAMKTR